MLITIDAQYTDDLVPLMEFTNEQLGAANREIFTGMIQPAVFPLQLHYALFNPHYPRFQPSFSHFWPTSRPWDWQINIIQALYRPLRTSLRSTWRWSECVFTTWSNLHCRWWTRSTKRRTTSRPSLPRERNWRACQRPRWSPDIGKWFQKWKLLEIDFKSWIF